MINTTLSIDFLYQVFFLATIYTNPCLYFILQFDPLPNGGLLILNPKGISLNNKINKLKGNI